MIRPGERLENPVTGEVLIFHETAAETGGELVRVETIVEPDGFVAATHVHPSQTERFDILEGTVEFRVGGETVQASAGDEVVVPAGTPHRFRNPGDEEARFLLEVRPALKFESLIETMFTLAAEGKTGRRGLPGPFRLAVIAREHFDTVRLPFPPAAMQRAALAVGAPLGRALGYEPTVERRAARDESRLERRYDRGRPHGSPERRDA
ncbi:MAG TPA: cupin domain-containing protein [Gaiellaceae bacterium]|nr:cupin domain-containing protein [Gaiellaceae bacterium]